MASDLKMLDVCLNTEGILSVKQKLKDKLCKDDVLLSNLDFAEQVFRHSPLCKAIILKVKGQWQCVKFGKAKDTIYTVTSDDGQPHIDGCVYGCDDIVLSSDVKSIHFSMHSCQNEKKNCFTEAVEAANSGSCAFKIVCNRFSITYMVKGVPEEIRMIKTKCQLKLCKIEIEALLEKKCWIEKEKAHCRELIACMEYLIQKFLTIPNAPRWSCKFFLQGDKEVVEISTDGDRYQNQYVLMYTANSEVFMSPPPWK